MANKQEYLNNLTQKFETLLSKQELFAKELMALHKEIERLKRDGLPSSIKEITKPVLDEKKVYNKEVVVNIPVANKTKEEIVTEKPLLKKEVPQIRTAPNKTATNKKSNLEKFIGENLLSKIGIIILVLGIAIGAKYSIENNLISPLTRIIIGYITGIGLMAFGIKLKEKYKDFSAVLVSGSIATLYFITYAAYDFYNLFPQIAAFIIMAILTVFTVIASVNYNKQVISHIGLVGAYAVPFLLSNGSGQVGVLFGYMAIINIGILVLSFKKDWKSLFYAAFFLTWVIYASWYLSSYDYNSHFTVALIYLSVFFLIFYITFLANKTIKKEAFGASSIIILLLNSVLFFSIGYALLNENETLQQYLGLFTLVNAILHFIAGAFIYKKKLADQKLLYFVLGMVFIFITIAIPVQLDGNWVSLLWIGIAAVLFWIGKTKDATILKTLSYPLMLLAIFSLLDDWGAYNLLSYSLNNTKSNITPIINYNFLSSMLFVAALAFMNYINNKHLKKTAKNSISFVIPLLLILVLFGAFFVEIWYYWQQRFLDSTILLNKENLYANPRNYDITNYQIIWLLNYTLLFVSVLGIVNIKKIKNRALGIVNIVVNNISLFIYLTLGLYMLSELRESYINPSEDYNSGIFHLGIRYVSYIFVAILLYTLHIYGKQGFMKINFKIPFSIILNITALWILSSELIHWIDISGSQKLYGLGLSILWSFYSFFLVAKGIWKKTAYIRIVGIVLFGITIMKLFFYDLASLNTISKTIVLMILGLLILGVSFLYNKFKNKIFDDTKPE